MSTPKEIAAKLLDFGNKDYDVALLDKVVGSLETGSPEERRWSHELLVKMQDHPQAWSRVDTILEKSRSDNTKFMAILFLQRVIRFKWKMVPESQQKSIRSYLIQLIVRLSGEEKLLAQHGMLLGKLNICLVQLLKQDWPHKWPTFITDLVKSSRASESVCQNNMEILRLLNEEVFDFSSGQLTQDKVVQLKAQLKEEFALIFRLCDFVLKNSKRVAVVQATLKTLSAFLSWIPAGFFFETSLIPMILDKFLTPQPFRTLTLQCLTEIAGMTFEGGQYDSEFARMCTMVVEKLGTFLPPDTDFKKAVSKGVREDEVFVGHLALFFTTFLSKHLGVMEKPDNRQVNLRAHAYVVSLSMVENKEVFKLCVEYWNKLASDLYLSAPAIPSSTLSSGDLQQGKHRQGFYSEVLSKVRVVMISRMAKPEEVLIVTDELGNAERVRVHQDTDQIQLYKLMRETLIYLTHLNYPETENVMLVKLAGQVDGSEWSHHNLNTLCWAVGAISGAHTEVTEKRFLVTVIKELLSMCERTRGKDNKAIIASNIMYIVGQYPRFLRAHWTFLKTVVKKLFEFMHEHHPGVRDMACDTFLEISHRCKRKFVTLQPTEEKPFVVEIMDNLGDITEDLEPGQRCVFFEALGIMISSCTELQKRERYVEMLMMLPNRQWGEIMRAAAKDVSSLYDAEGPARHLALVLRLNTRACGALGQSFIPQLKHIYLDMLNVYKVYARAISEALSGSDAMASNRPVFRHMRTVQRQILELMETFVETSADPTMFYKNFVRLPDNSSPLLSAVLQSFKGCHKDGREPAVLSLMTAIIHKLKSLMIKEVGNILDHVFEPTLEIITVSREAAPDMRLQYYRLLRAINEHMFIVFAKLPPGSFKVVMDGLVWGFKNPKPEIAEAALLLLMELLEKVSQQADLASTFYQKFFLMLLRQVFIVITDPFFISGFDHQARLLWQMVHLVEGGKIRVALWERGSQPEGMTPQRFVRIYVRDMLIKAFPNVRPQAIEEFVRRLFDTNIDMAGFRGLLRDFLVQMKEWSNVDRSALMSEERRAMREVQHREELRKAAVVPGLLPVKEREERMSLE